MSGQWIEASRARSFSQSAFAICTRLHAGLIASRAQLVIIDELRGENVLLPKTFWWAEGHDGLEQDWERGDFSTWIDGKQHWQAFNVKFNLSSVLEMMPIEGRALAARKFSVSGNPDWTSAKSARATAYELGGFNPIVAGPAVLEQARLGFLTARAVTAQGSNGYASEAGWDWEEREWDIPSWFWEKFTTEKTSSQDWELGKFVGQGIGPDGLRRVKLGGVHFLKASLETFRPLAEIQKPTLEVTKNVGGRPPAAFTEDLLCAVWSLINQGDLQPKKQAEIERVMHDWSENNGHELGNTKVRDLARKVFGALNTEVENPIA